MKDQKQKGLISIELVRKMLKATTTTSDKKTQTKIEGMQKRNQKVEKKILGDRVEGKFSCTLEGVKHVGDFSGSKTQIKTDNSHIATIEKALVTNEKNPRLKVLGEISMERLFANTKRSEAKNQKVSDIRINSLIQESAKMEA